MTLKELLHEFDTQVQTFQGHHIYDPKEYNMMFLSNEAYNQINLILTALYDKEQVKPNDGRKQGKTRK